MTLSPQYTPFNGDEVSLVLGLSRAECEYAERAGVLERNIHFEARVSHTTAMHSMVDVVKFDALRLLGWPSANTSALSPQLDFGLDMLCRIYEDHPLPKIMQDQKLLLEILNDMFLGWDHPFGNMNNAFAPNVQKVLIAAWTNGWRNLTEILRSDAIRSDLDGRQNQKLSLCI